MLFFSGLDRGSLRLEGFDFFVRAPRGTDVMFQSSSRRHTTRVENPSPVLESRSARHKVPVGGVGGNRHGEGGER